MQNGEHEQDIPVLPRVVVMGLASCYGCQLGITNAEKHLTEVLGQIDLRYWQLTSSEPMPDVFDVAVIEGAVTTEESVNVVKRARDIADVVITIGACAATAGIPGMAAQNYEGRAEEVYGDELPVVCENMVSPHPIKEEIDVDYEVLCCPIDSYDFIDMLHRVLYGSNKSRRSSTMCGDCKRNEQGCFYGRKVMCLGLITRSGCGARCPNLGRPCNGCAGVSPDANLNSAREVCERFGVDVNRFNKALEMFNQANPVFDSLMANDDK